MNQMQVNVNPDFYFNGVRSDQRIGQILLDSGKIKVEDAERILRVQKENGLRFGDAARHLGLVTDVDIQQVLSQQFEYPYLAEGEGSYSTELVAAYAPFSQHVESLRALRSQLMLRWFNSDRKLLTVSGAGKGEGVSYTVANLAVVFSQLGERTLLIDADLRSPRQHEIFRLASHFGLSDLIAEKASMDVIQKVPGFVDLSILGAGTIPPNPQELIGRERFNDLLRVFSDIYDVILIDTTSTDVAADAQIVASRANGVLMVVRPGHTRLSEAIRHKELVNGAGAMVVGTVLNQF